MLTRGRQCIPYIIDILGKFWNSVTAAQRVLAQAVEIPYQVLQHRVVSVRVFPGTSEPFAKSPRSFGAWRTQRSERQERNLSAALQLGNIR
jgi:hypothetical protein